MTTDEQDEVKLDLPAAEAKLYAAFCELQVEHRLQAEAFEEVWQRLVQSRHSQRRPGTEGQITLLYGPTGVGKTALWDACMARCKTLHRQRALPGRLPYLYTLCDVPSSGVWQMKPFYSATLVAADEILIDQKQLITPSTTPQTSWRATTDGLRQATLNMLRNREPLVFCIDEAHHLGIHSSEDQKEKNLDAIKTFADAASAPILMVGSYELIQFQSRSGRLGRRARPVHLRRYLLDDAEDQNEFESVVTFFQEHLPQGGFAFADEYLTLMDQTLGCVGLLKQWLDRAYFNALWSERRDMRKRDLQDTAPSPDLVERWLEEINTGETELRERAKGASKTPTQSTMKTTRARKTSGRHPKPFQRKKIADPVDTARHARVAASSRAA